MDDISPQKNRRHFRWKRAHYIDLHIHQKNVGISLKEGGPFFDSRKTLVDMTANAHFVEIYSKGTPELHTFLSKKLSTFPTEMSRFFWGKYHRFFRHKNTGSPSCQCSVCVSLSKGSTSTTYTPEKCLDFSQGS